MGAAVAAEVGPMKDNEAIAARVLKVMEANKIDLDEKSPAMREFIEGLRNALKKSHPNSPAHLGAQEALISIALETEQNPERKKRLEAARAKLEAQIEALTEKTPAAKQVETTTTPMAAATAADPAAAAATTPAKKPAAPSSQGMGTWKKAGIAAAVLGGGAWATWKYGTPALKAASAALGTVSLGKVAMGVAAVGLGGAACYGIVKYGGKLMKLLVNVVKKVVKAIVGVRQWGPMMNPTA